MHFYCLYYSFTIHNTNQYSPYFFSISNTYLPDSYALAVYTSREIAISECKRYPNTIMDGCTLCVVHYPQYKERRNTELNKLKKGLPIYFTTVIQSTYRICAPIICVPHLQFTITNTFLYAKYSQSYNYIIKCI